jgi:hypothetical protein
MPLPPPIPQPLTAPPRPRVVFRIGVTGHRPNRLNAAQLPELEATVERILREALTQLAALAAETLPPGAPAPILRVLCSLAEGSDRIVARIALRLGCDLQVVLPFLRPDYETDFTTPASLEEFRSLLARASAVVELNTLPRDRAFGYRDAGDTLLNQSDLLLAIWDGKPSAGIGGTIDVIEHAEARGIPTCILDPNAPASVVISTAYESLATAAEPTAALAAIITQTITLSPTHFFWAEPRPARNDTTSYTLLRLLGEYKLSRAPQPQPDLCALDLRTPPLCPYFHWADTLAVHYGERSRSAGLRLQLLASLAVLCALLRIPMEESVLLLRVLSITEMLAILCLLFTAVQVASSHWHERWLFYRSLAEQVRCLDILLPIAQTLPAPPVLGFAREDDGHTDFANRYILAIERETGLLPAVADESFLAERLQVLQHVITQQAEFHGSAATRYDRVQKLLHRSGMALFIAAVALCVYELLRAFAGPAGHTSWLATASAILPALGAAAASVAAQSELKRLAGRSAAMSQTLRETLTQVARLTPPTLRSVIALSRRVAEILTSEVRDWRVLVSSKRPELPT